MHPILSRLYHVSLILGILYTVALGGEPSSPAAEGPVITTILGCGLKKAYFNPSDQQIHNAAKEFAEAGFTMSWAASPKAWGKGKDLLQDDDYFAHMHKVGAILRQYGIGVALGFHWHRILPTPLEENLELYGEILEPKDGSFERKNWNFGSEIALQAFAQRSETLFEKTGPFEMFYCDEVTLAKAGPKMAIQRSSGYWTSPTYSVQALESFRIYLASKAFPQAQKARFPVTTIAQEPSAQANQGLPAIAINDTNRDRLMEDNDWPNSPLWQHWYAWRCQLFSRWLDTVTTLAYEANKTNSNWMGCYYETPVQWMIPELGQDLQQIVNLPHVDYVVAGYTSGERYHKVKKAADAAGKKWGLQVEVSRYGKEDGMPIKYIENTFKNAMNDGASLITCYAGLSFRTDRKIVSEKDRKNGWYYMPQQVKVWESCIQWLKKTRGLKAPTFSPQTPQPKAQQVQ